MYNMVMSDEVLKFNPNGQWTLIKHRVLPQAMGGVRADIPRPEVGQRGHQGKQLAIADSSPRPTPKEIKIGATSDSSSRAHPESISADSRNNIKSFGPNGERIDGDDFKEEQELP